MKLVAIAITFLLGGIGILSAQEEMGAIALRYPFLDTSKNHIEFFGKSDGMEKFYQKLDKAIFDNEGKVNIVHVGREEEIIQSN